MKKAKSAKASKKTAKPARSKSAKAVKTKKPAKKVSKPAKSAKSSRPVKKIKPVKAAKKLVKPTRKAGKKTKPASLVKVVKKAIKKAVKNSAKLIKAVKAKIAKPVKPKKEKTNKSVIPVSKAIYVKPSEKMKEMPGKKVSEKIVAKGPERSRYKDDELKEFKELILHKLEDARKELNNLQSALLNSNEHGTDDTASTFKMLEDGSDTLAKEEAGQLALRQRKFIEQLENALVRIENKTYGICRVTGKLIPKERLRAVPHTTQSIEAKRQQYHD